MFSRIGSLLLFLVALSITARATGWINARYGVAIDSFPAGWSVRTGDTQVRLEKEFNRDGYGYAYNEYLTFGISVGQNQSIENAAEQLSASGYLLQERTRVQLGEGTLPLWIFFHQANEQEVSWVAIVLRVGLVYTFEVRGTPLDRGLLNDFKSVIDAFHFLSDGRQEAWSALETQDANRAYRLFRRLVAAEPSDGNALYGLGLAELALGHSGEALTHLKQADRIIGLDQIRPALAQAYSQTGDPLRAVTLWYQAIEDDPNLEDELEPDIANAVAQAHIANRTLPTDRELIWEDFEFIAGAVLIDLQDSLMDARSGDFDPRNLPMWETARERSQLLFTELLKHLLAEGGAEIETHYLAASYGVLEAVQKAVYGLRHSDLEVMEEAALRLHEALEAFSVSAPQFH